MLENINIENKNGEMVVSSREVANNFEKEHSKVLRSIENLIKTENSVLIENQPSQNWLRYFIPNEYKDLKGETRKEYLVTRDGFSLLVMGFTGEKALKWKLKYIEAFNKMEKTIQKVLPSNYKEALQQLLVSEEEKERLLLENTQQQQIIGELKPKADYTDKILQNKGLVTITAIAKDYGMAAPSMNKKLHELGVQYKQSGQWFLYEKYHDKGYTHSETIDLKHKDGNEFIRMNTKWTQKGRLFLYELLKKNGIFPMIEREA